MDSTIGVREFLLLIMLSNHTAFSRLLGVFATVALFGASCTFSNFHPDLPQAVAPGYQVVRATPSWTPTPSFEKEVVWSEASAPTPLEPAEVVEPDEEIMVITPLDLADGALHGESYAMAFDLYTEFLSDHAETPNLFYKAGFCAFMLGTENPGEEWFPRATSLVQRALELEPQHGDAQFILACCYDWQDEFFAAEQAYTRAIELSPGHQKSIRNLIALYQRQGLDAKADELMEMLRLQKN